MRQDSECSKGMSARELAERLEEYPELKERVEELLAVVENAKGDAGKADEAEERVTEEIRKVGLVLMQSWAKRKNERVSREADQRSDMARKEKKTSTGTRDMDESR
jgi:hypothetical protein